MPGTRKQNVGDTARAVTRKALSASGMLAGIADSLAAQKPPRRR